MNFMEIGTILYSRDFLLSVYTVRCEPIYSVSTVRSTAYLSSSGVGVDGDLAGAPTVAVDRGGHLLSGEEGDDLFLGRNILSALGLLQRLADEMGKQFDL